MAEVLVPGLKSHALGCIGKRVKEFDEPIYFIALFLLPQFKTLAISKKMVLNEMSREILKCAQAWRFSKPEAIQLVKEVISYANGDPPFHLIEKITDARLYWASFPGASPMLRRFAMSVLAIVPHSAAVERLFSSLGLIKNKTRNQLTPGSLSILGQLRTSLQMKCDRKRETKKRKVCSEVVVNEPQSTRTVIEAEEANDATNLESIEVETLESTDISPGDLEVVDSFFDLSLCDWVAENEREGDVEAEAPAANSSTGNDWSVDDILGLNAS